MVVNHILQLQRLGLISGLNITHYALKRLVKAQLRCQDMRQNVLLV